MIAVLPAVWSLARRVDRDRADRVDDEYRIPPRRVRHRRDDPLRVRGGPDLAPRPGVGDLHLAAAGGLAGGPSADPMTPELEIGLRVEREEPHVTGQRVVGVCADPVGAQA